MKTIFASRETGAERCLQKDPGRKYHIDGMKGLLCFLVMLGHFWNIYRLCQERSGFTSYMMDLVRGTFLENPLMIASFWLYAFLVISGYLLSATRVRSIPELLKKTAKRFLRFFLPVFGACVFIYLLQETVGFHTHETKAYFTNNWFQKYYQADLGWTAIFTESIRAMTAAACSFNAPFWVIRDMFVSSVVIYVCNYVDHGRVQKNEVLPLVFFGCAVAVDRPVIIACMAGYLLGYYKDWVQKLTQRKLRFWLVSICAFCAVKLIMKWKILPTVFDNIFLYILVWCIMVAYVNQSEKLAAFFSAKPFLWMGKISFGVYSFHWPVICSVGSYVLIWCLENHCRTLVAFGLSLLASILCTVILSVIYLVTVEKAADNIIRRVIKG